MPYNLDSNAISNMRRRGGASSKIARYTLRDALPLCSRRVLSQELLTGVYLRVEKEKFRELTI